MGVQRGRLNGSFPSSEPESTRSTSAGTTITYGMDVSALENRVDKLERSVERLERSVERLERNVARLVEKMLPNADPSPPTPTRSENNSGSSAGSGLSDPANAVGPALLPTETLAHSQPARQESPVPVDHAPGGAEWEEVVPTVRELVVFQENSPE
ncbi:hypothetical protein HMN09_01163100 [Mycena chlorophos]|uniref:Uncharacterized protein n=1 Tax=Mycena chlorophos TaxID=658473 RepID=A0A8H6VZY2_MYCCL|nr:hypothetical protein HMN09_01163100 [Mycena chlorophos]